MVQIDIKFHTLLTLALEGGHIRDSVTLFSRKHPTPITPPLPLTPPPPRPVGWLFDRSSAGPMCQSGHREQGKIFVPARNRARIQLYIIRKALKVQFCVRQVLGFWVRDQGLQEQVRAPAKIFFGSPPSKSGLAKNLYTTFLLIRKKNIYAPPCLQMKQATAEKIYSWRPYKKF
jgi:hypothetical protein